MEGGRVERVGGRSRSTTRSRSGRTETVRILRERSSGSLMNRERDERGDERQIRYYRVRGYESTVVSESLRNSDETALSVTEPVSVSESAQALRQALGSKKIEHEKPGAQLLLIRCLREKCCSMLLTLACTFSYPMWLCKGSGREG